ncbi:Dehydrogenases with different specificities (related to short-chain alcohol dehydrogenases) [Polynucleobacter duraquae]|uniref:Dehydrogenases with different specificities (Related to short-chain alcohol dehydrogenases) n=1 Tax=Polynucleobacter duraquae TaxID=1835254 RepID=A0A0E3V223_9BURK|nr:SDR family NAD(P)-dependent oxidoreductase [Polynucleobacter duraquae]AKD25983.1 Dehydrogenases with different specificities (related to short-chain alcohol dehydrogenases) [Polynucleobacter duraquae]
MPLVPKPFRALIIGSSGTIGSAFMELLEASPDCEVVWGLSRNSAQPINYQDLGTIESAAASLIQEGPFQLIINTIGVLHSEHWMPEKKLDDLNAEQLQILMQTNAIGPGLTIKHFSKLLDPAGSVMATLSAKVGSIEDNRLGGWFSYRASKAALNMLIKTASIEFARTKPNTALVALHPGTVNSRLSKPFKGEHIGRPALDAASDMLAVLLSLQKTDSGIFLSYSGEKLPW